MTPQASAAKLKLLLAVGMVNVSSHPHLRPLPKLKWRIVIETPAPHSPLSLSSQAYPFEKWVWRREWMVFLLFVQYFYLIQWRYRLILHHQGDSTPVTYGSIVNNINTWVNSLWILILEFPSSDFNHSCIFWRSIEGCWCRAWLLVWRRLHRL